MADYIHNVLREFRDTMLSAVARLEFQIRDIPQKNAVPDFENTIQSLIRRMDAMEVLQRDSGRPVQMAVVDTPIAEDILKMRADTNTRNVIVSNVRSTPALSAAIAAANPPALELSAVHPVELEEGNWIKEPASETDAEEEEEGSVEDEQLKKVVIKGVSYYMDDDKNVYHETEEGYEQVGVYNPQTDSVELVDEEAEEEADAEEAEEEGEGEEEAVEVEEFVYKGRTYQRDDENNVYEDGELIGTWNGKSIEPLETTEA